MEYINTKKIRHTKLICTGMCILLALGACFKFSIIGMKLSYFDRGEKLYAAGSMVAAEECFADAQNIKSFQYKEDIISQRMSALKEITDMKAALRDTVKKAREASDHGKYSELLAAYESYRAQNQKASLKSRETLKTFEEVVAFLDFKSELAGYFTEALERMKKDAEDNIRTKKFANEEFIKFAIEAPAEYYGGEAARKQASTAFLKDYYGRKLDITAADNGLSQTVEEAKKIIKLYKDNKLDCSWIIDKMEATGEKLVNADIAKNDYIALSLHISQYQSFITAYKSKSKVLKLADTKFQQDIARAAEYIKKKDFKAAIELYKNLQHLKDTAKYVMQAELKWAKHDPVHLLIDQFGNMSFKNVQYGDAAWDSAAYALGSDDSGILYMAKLGSNAQYTGMQRQIFSDGTAIKGLYTYNGLGKPPIIVIEGASDQRKAKYIGIEVRDGQLNEVFSFEADGFQGDSDHQLIVDNPTGDGAGNQCIYALSNGRYEFSSIIKDYEEIELRYIYYYQNQKVRFSCRIEYMDEDSGAAIVSSEDYYAVLTNCHGLQQGYYYDVTGVFAGERTMDNGAVLPEINVSNVVQPDF